jgi:hypothetical protein
MVRRRMISMEIGDFVMIWRSCVVSDGGCGAELGVDASQCELESRAGLGSRCAYCVILSADCR